MKPNNSSLSYAFCIVASGMLLVSGAAANEMPEIHDILARSFVSTNAFGDATLGNGWLRTDRFTNVDSGQYRVRLDWVECLFLNPEDVGYSDITNDNGWDVVAAAEAIYPDYMFGASFWVNQNPPPVNWTNSGSTVDLGGAWLDSNEYLTLLTTAHNDIIGMPGPPNEHWDLVGELVVGFKFGGAVAPVPEPATSALLGVGSILLGRRRNGWKHGVTVRAENQQP